MSAARQRRAPGAPRQAASPTHARLVALRVLERVEHGRAFADLALDAALRQSDLPHRERAFATELVYGALRWRGRLDFALAAALDRPLAEVEPPLVTLLRLGAYQLLMCSGMPARAAVDQTVRCTHAAGYAHAAAFVNAVLRQLARRAGELRFPALADDPLGHLVHALSIPHWIAERWCSALGPFEAAALAAASNEPAPLSARVNPQRGSRDDLLAELRVRRPLATACPHAPLGVWLGRGDTPANDPAFLDGRFTFQDEASQLVVELLAPKPGERVLDLCAAPGTKTTAIAEQVGPAGSVLAIDRHPRRLGLVERATRRLGLANVQLLAGDGATIAASLPGPPFDRVLVDAPCSGLGTLRRNPDARWRLRPQDPAQLAVVQRALLRSGAAALRQGGTLVYSTCTLTVEENETVVAEFLADQRGEFAVESALPSPLRPFLAGDGFLRTWPHHHGMDGFFAARFTKRGDGR